MAIVPEGFLEHIVGVQWGPPLFATFYTVLARPNSSIPYHATVLAFNFSCSGDDVELIDNGATVAKRGSPDTSVGIQNTFTADMKSKLNFWNLQGAAADGDQFHNAMVFNVGRIRRTTNASTLAFTVSQFLDPSMSNLTYVVALYKKLTLCAIEAGVGVGNPTTNDDVVLLHRSELIITDDTQVHHAMVDFDAKTTAIS